MDHDSLQDVAGTESAAVEKDNDFEGDGDVKITNPMQEVAGTESGAVEKDDNSEFEGDGEVKMMNPSWDTYYQATVQEAPAMIILLSKAWSDSEICHDELIWFLSARTGVDLSNQTPNEMRQELFMRPADQLRAIRSGAFVVLCDRHSESSDAFNFMTKKLGFPRSHFFKPNQSCIDEDLPDLTEALRHFIAVERHAEAYELTRLGFFEVAAKDAVTAIQVSRPLIATVKSNISSDLISGTINTMKVLLGNLQILGSIKDIMNLSWPPWLTSIMRHAKVFAGGFMEIFEFFTYFNCLGGYDYASKFYVTVLVPLILLALTAVITLAKIKLGTANEKLGESDFSATKVTTRAISISSVLVFLL